MRRFAGLSCDRYYPTLSTADAVLSTAACGYRPRIDRQRSPEFAGLSFSARFPRSMRSILYEFFPDGLYCWVKCPSACMLLPGQYSCTCPATTSTPTGVSAGAARSPVQWAWYAVADWGVAGLRFT